MKSFESAWRDLPDLIKFASFCTSPNAKCQRLLGKICRTCFNRFKTSFIIFLNAIKKEWPSTSSALYIQSLRTTECAAYRCRIATNTFFRCGDFKEVWNDNSLLMQILTCRALKPFDYGQAGVCVQYLGTRRGVVFTPILTVEIGFAFFWTQL